MTIAPSYATAERLSASERVVIDAIRKVQADGAGFGEVRVVVKDRRITRIQHEHVDLVKEEGYR